MGNMILGGQPEATGAVTGRADVFVRRERSVGRRPAWALSDIGIGAALAAQVPLSWLLPERSWEPFWRLAARFPLTTSRSAIRRTAEGIAAALGERDRRRAEAIAEEIKAAVYEMRFQDLRAWRPGGWNPSIALEGEDHLKAALAGGKGAILWLAPFVFNNGPTKIAFHRQGYRVSHLSSPQHGYSETRLGIATLNRVRCIPEDRYLAQRIVFDENAPSTAMRRMMRALKAGEVVSIVAASTEGFEMIKGPIFDGRLPVAIGAPRLAGLTGAPILPVFTVRDPAIGFRVAVEAPIVPLSGVAKDEGLIAATSEFLRRSEPWVRRYPGQWRAWSKWRR